MIRGLVIALALIVAPSALGQGWNSPGQPAYRDPPQVITTEHQWGHPLLNRVASAFASRPVSIKCRPEIDDSVLSWAYGYVYYPTYQQKWATLENLVCFGALAIKSDTPDITDWNKAIGVAVLIHESYHLRRYKDVTASSIEAATECRAMGHYDIGLLKLGANQTELARLMPVLLNFHLRLVSNHSQYYTQCALPDRYWRFLDPFGPDPNETSSR